MPFESTCTPLLRPYCAYNVAPFLMSIVPVPYAPFSKEFEFRVVPGPLRMSVPFPVLSFPSSILFEKVSVFVVFGVVRSLRVTLPVASWPIVMSFLEGMSAFRTTVP